MFYTMSMSSDIIVSHHLTLSHMPLHSYASSCSKAKREKKIKYKGPEQIITSQTLDHTHTHTLSLSLFSTKKNKKKKRHFISPWPNQLWLQNCLDLSLISLISLISLSSLPLPLPLPLSLILSNIWHALSLSSPLYQSETRFFWDITSPLFFFRKLETPRHITSLIHLAHSPCCYLYRTFSQG